MDLLDRMLGHDVWTTQQLLTHSMHHRAQIMYLLEKLDQQEHVEGDRLSWESQAFGWAKHPA